MTRLLASLCCYFCFGTTAAAQEPIVTFGTSVVIPSGLRGLIYHIKHNTTKLPDFEKLKPAGTIYASSLNSPPQSFDRGFPGVTKRFEWFAIHYSGRFWIDSPGRYNFSLTSDDGAKLYIDDLLIVDNDGQHPPTEKTGSVDLSGGIHQIQVSYFQGPRFLVALILRVARDGEELRVFSTDEFKPLHPEDFPNK
jgi:hypothetical protein